jgi:hypothetical protein
LNPTNTQTKFKQIFQKNYTRNTRQGCQYSHCLGMIVVSVRGKRGQFHPEHFSNWK